MSSPEMAQNIDPKY